MLPLRTTLKNVGPFVSQRIDWQDLGPLVAIVGTNGSGKTFLIEAELWLASTATWPSRTKAIYDYIHPGQTEGTITVNFEYDGKFFYANRTFSISNNKRTQKATLYETDEFRPRRLWNISRAKNNRVPKDGRPAIRRPRNRPSHMARLPEEDRRHHWRAAFRTPQDFRIPVRVRSTHLPV